VLDIQIYNVQIFLIFHLEVSIQFMQQFLRINFDFMNILILFMILINQLIFFDYLHLLHNDNTKDQDH